MQHKLEPFEISFSAFASTKCSNLTVFTTMSKVEGIWKEIAGMKAFVDKRYAATNGQSDSAALEQKLAKSIAKNISNLVGVDRSVSTMLYAAIGDSGVAAGIRSQLVAAVDEKFQGKPEDDRSTSNHTQKHVNPDTWVTAKLHESLSDPRKDIDIKLEYTAEFLAKSGVRHCSESTAKWWLAMVLALHCQHGWPTYKTIKEYDDTLKLNITASRKPWPFALIYTYQKKSQKLASGSLHTHLW